MPYRNGMPLCAKYPSRYECQTKYYNEKEENKMPTMPEETQYKKMTNGLHTLITLTHSTVEGRYGTQEQVSCLLDEPDANDDSVNQRIWISHSSYKKIKMCEAAGIVKIEDGEWNVIDGVKFRVLVSQGRVQSVLPYEEPAE